MALTNIFKKEAEVVEKKTPSKEKASLAWRVLEHPYISEKATDLAKENKYVFKVTDKSNKTSIKKAIKEVYNVDALDVKIIKISRKKKRLGRHQGWKKGFKKAIVEIKEGQKIDVYPS
jgi:large subunit ribosomal protein L23